jgi:FkbM family methyltransferase
MNLYTFYSKLFARRSLYKLHKLLYLLSLRGMGVLNWESDRISGEEFLLKKYLPTALKTSRPIIFDIGANVGNYSKKLSENFPNVQIYSIEPHPNNFKRLKELELSNVKPFELALGSQEGTVSLFDRNDSELGSEHSSLYKEVIEDIHHQVTKEYKVELTTLDSFAKKEGIGRIDLLKIDTEGNELEVLKGAKELLEKNKIGFIHFEFNEMNKVSKTFMIDFFKMLPNHVLHRLLPDGLVQLTTKTIETEIFAYQNIIAVPKEN